MNDTELENLLRSMTPAAPSADLAGRVRHDMELMAAFRDTKPQAAVAISRLPAHWLANLVWAGLGAAAAVVVMGMATHLGSAASATAAVASPAAVAPSVASASGVMPVSSTKEWVDVEDMGITYATPGSPSRQMKVLSLERYQWTDPRDGAEYTVEMPQEESLALPVKYQ